jgi:F0F1-type ATP synthase assembly protein I
MKSHASHRPGDLAKTTRDAFGTMSMSSVGLEMGVAVILGLLAGMWADKKLGTEPWLLLLGTMLGLAAGVRGIFRAVREADRLAAAREKEAQP